MQGHIHRRESRDRKGKKKVLWYVVIDIGRDANGKRRQKWYGSFPTRRDADAARAALVHSHHSGTLVIPSSATLENWVRERWLPTMRTQVKPSTWSSYARNCDLHLLPRLGHVQLRRLTPTLITATYTELLANGRRNGDRAGLSPKTVRYLHSTLHKALTDAVDAGLLASNPAQRARPPKPGRTSHQELRSWTPAQLRAFLELTAGDRLGAAWHLAAMTGMRRGEVLGLRWADLDVNGSRLSVRHTIISVDYEICSSSPKAHKARVIDLDPRTIELLEAHRERQRAERTEWGTGYLDGDLVFARENGTPLQPDSFSHAFQRLIADSSLPRIRLHDLRHTHASIALAAGVPIKVVSERLGHESPAFTLKQYAHALPGMQAEAAARIADLVAAAEMA